MREKIQTQLKEIETTEDVFIFYACESGSRAWGFPSQDSDYDVRFLYIHKRDWYLSIDLENKRDVIECPISGMLDVNGWDIRKALQLLQKGSPPLTEWLNSPIIYKETTTLAEQLRALIKKYYSSSPAMYHYLRMAQGNYREYLKGETVRAKKYFYVLRPLLAILWIENGFGLVPTEFQRLVDKVISSETLKHEIESLISAKRSGAELDDVPRISVISEFIEMELKRLNSVRFEDKYEKISPPIVDLNHWFRAALQEVSAF